MPPTLRWSICSKSPENAKENGLETTIDWAAGYKFGGDNGAFFSRYPRNEEDIRC